MKHNKQTKRGRGQSLVEVALVLPIIMMIMLGVLDFGRAFYMQLALRDAADEGATYASIRPTDEAGIKQRTVDASTVLFTIDPNSISIIAPNIVAGAPITVTIAHPMTLFTPFAQGFVGGADGVNVIGEATHPIITP